MRTMLRRVDTIMNNKLDQKKFDDIYFEGKPMYDKVNGGTFNVVYMREYIDPENECETFGCTKQFIEMYLISIDQNLIMKK